MTDPAVVTAADIARLAGVTRGTVSNWRRRHTDFPKPVGGTDASPAYDRTEVEAWLSGRGALPELPPEERLWRAVTRAAADRPLDEVVLETLDVELAREAPAEIADFLLNRYADSAGVPATPQAVAELMAELADAVGHDVLDPAAGTGELLSAALAFADPHYGPAHAFGQELDGGLARLAQSRLRYLADDSDVKVEIGDSLRDDRFADLRVDSVLCHPPFGDRNWGLEELTSDARWKYGLPPRAEPELAWVQHALAHLKPGGRAALLMPPAAASRPSGRRIRAELLRRGALRAVISLPAGAVSPRHVAVHLWVLEQPTSPGALDPRVLLVEGAAYADEGDIADGWAGFARMVLSAWNQFTKTDPAGPGQPGNWQVVRAIDLLDETVDLTPARHVLPAETAMSPSRTLDEVRTLTAGLRAALAVVDSGLGKHDWRAGKREQSWRTATIADLVRHGTLEFYRGPGGSRQVEEIHVRNGDVLVPAAASGQLRVVVNDADETTPLGSYLHVIRPNPDVFDSWYLAGFLAAPASVQQASYGTAMTRIDARRLTVPLLPLDRQRRYGEIFRRLHEIEAAITHAKDVAEDLASLLTRSLADGTLLPAENGAALEETGR